MTPGDVAEVRTFIDDEPVSRASVDGWERRRVRAVLTKLGTRLGRRAVDELLDGRSVDELRGADLDDQRAALSDMKARLGHAGTYALIRNDLKVSEAMTRMALTVSRGRRTYAVARLQAPDRSAQQFAAWFTELTTLDREAEMMQACPDHYLLRGLVDGRQEVVETTGGAPTASRFIVDYNRTDDLTVPVDPGYPVQVAGQALLDDGTCIGGVRHQFRDHDGVLEALLTVEFPRAVPGWMVRQHQWHLAVEFGNWIRAGALPVRNHG
ncbi:hypothetical protein [Williamsia sterculiae]|uniref:Uncharacterized protein n=1 Tax=Williamsia sterculiae TaxID=1344003 RepID=A0A1N7FJ26_9NOCA|nr:hypothetical protein [Williamsia sterculiae]SIS00297.1 hypothetical protein SAMN05445060_2113 [Williamsia sterculiae]